MQLSLNQTVIYAMWKFVHHGILLLIGIFLQCCIKFGMLPAIRKDV